MIEDAPEEQLRLLAEVDILEELPRSEVEYVDARAPIVRLSKKESLALDGNLRGCSCW